MADKVININVSTKTPQKVNVSSSQEMSTVAVSNDASKYYSQLAKSWATSDVIVENIDYSSKYYASKAEIHENNAKSYLTGTQEVYTNVQDVASGVIDEIEGVRVGAVESVTAVATAGVASVEQKVNSGIANIESEATEGVSLVNTAKTNAVNEVNTNKTNAVNAVKTEGQNQVKSIKATGFYMENDKLYFTNSKGEKEEFKSGGGGLEIGDIGIAPLGIDETQGKRRYLNGQVIIQEQYVQFTNKVKSAVELYPSLACTEDEWQTTSTMTVGGQVGKFVIDDEAGTIRLPKIIMPIQGLTDLSKLAEMVEAGLPNITGRVEASVSGGSYTSTGALIASEKSQMKNVFASGSGTPVVNYSIDASKSSAIYGKSNTVQQEQIQYPYFIQVATGAETEDNIINEIELNNPFSLLDYKYSEYELNNISWLRSQGQYNTRAVYPAVYDLLLKIYNGTETKAGVSVKLTTEDYSDIDFVLNTSDETFRLPISTNNSSQERLYFYVGETVQNANLINAGRIEETMANKSMVDGQWVAKTYWIFDINATETQTPTFSLAEYLPNDGYSYEVLISGYIQTVATSGAAGIVNVKKTAFIGDELGSALGLCYVRARSAATVQSQGSCVVPIGADRLIAFDCPITTGATVKATALAYRRIGTNV